MALVVAEVFEVTLDRFHILLWGHPTFGALGLLGLSVGSNMLDQIH